MSDDAPAAIIGRTGDGTSGRLSRRTEAAPGAPSHRGRAGEVLHVALGETALGAVLVARGAAGIAAILLGDDRETLVADLQRRFPAARLESGGDVDAVTASIEAPRSGEGALLALQLDVRGTPFQCRVWEALRRIPVGERLSYAELARRIGAPAAVRAVAGACAGNHHALAIPCHRVVRSDGTLSGYAWGVERKRTLLARERAL